MRTKFLFLNVIMMAMMAAVCMTFASCGSGSDDDDIPGGGANVKLKEGVHRIEVSFKVATEASVTMPSSLMPGVMICLLPFP